MKPKLLECVDCGHQQRLTAKTEHIDHEILCEECWCADWHVLEDKRTNGEAYAPQRGMVLGEELA